MSTAAVSSGNQYQAYLQQRQSDLKQLGQDLRAGDLTDAQTEFNTIQTLGQSGPFNGDAFSLSNRQQDFNALGQELQAGNLSGAQQAFATLRDTFRNPTTTGTSGDGGAPTATGTIASPGTPSSTTGGSEIVLNLGNAPAGEQITIDVNNGSNGGQQITVSATNPQSQSPDQVAFNLNPNSNEQIVLNLFNSAASSTQGSGTSGVNVSA